MALYCQAEKCTGLIIKVESGQQIQIRLAICHIFYTNQICLRVGIYETFIGLNFLDNILLLPIVKDSGTVVLPAAPFTKVVNNYPKSALHN